MSHIETHLIDIEHANWNTQWWYKMTPVWHSPCFPRQWTHKTRESHPNGPTRVKRLFKEENGCNKGEIDFEILCTLWRCQARLGNLEETRMPSWQTWFKKYQCLYHDQSFLKWWNLITLAWLGKIWRPWWQDPECPRNRWKDASGRNQCCPSSCWETRKIKKKQEVV